MKRFVTWTLIVILLLSLSSFAVAETLEQMAGNLLIEYPEEPGAVADEVHERLMAAFDDNELLVCGIMGNMHKESVMTPGRWEGDDTDDGEKSEAFSKEMHFYDDQAFPTRESRYAFAYSGLFPGHYGYGLIQWTALGRKEWLYDMAIDTDRRLDDVSLQCDFLIWEAETNYSEVFQELKAEPSLGVIVNRIASEYEKSNPNPLGIAVRYAFAKYYYEFYTGEEYVLP